jgi:hypothetical protein
MQSVIRSHAARATPSLLPVLDAEPAVFSQNFGNLPFALRHRLASSNLFTVDRLTAIAEKMLATGRGDRLAIFEGAKTAGDRFSKMKRKNPSAAAVPLLGQSNYWLSLINIRDVDPELDNLYQEAVQDAEALVGIPILKDVKRGYVTVVMASPHVITPYHIDHGHNFLCQLVGNKTVWLWDPDDRQNLSESEIERFYCGDMEAARYGVDTQLQGREFHIRPGDALYHPPLAPHWVQNGPQVSISVSIGFNTTALDRRARIYQANKILRKVGLHPPPPGHSRILDGLRSSTTFGIVHFKRSLRATRKARARSAS